jgi:agmatinase
VDVNRPDTVGYAGGATFSKLPLVLDPAGLAGVDVAILGAPLDEGVTYRPGTRFGPRAIRLADDSGGSPPERPHMHLGIDPFAELRVVDVGDAPVVPADIARSHAAVRASVLGLLQAGVFPVVLGGDHSVAHATIGAVAEHFGPRRVGVIHFDTHADTGAECWGVVRYSHGTPMRLLVDEGSVRGDGFVQIGLRGWWPEPPDFAWMREQGLRWHTIYEIDERGFDAVLDDVIAWAAGHELERFYLSVDVDVLDPAYAPGTGTPEPGGLTTRELLRAVCRIAREVELCGLEVVEVSPPYDHAEVTALAAHRTVLEALGGLALRRSGKAPAPERDARAGDRLPA